MLLLFDLGTVVRFFETFSRSAFSFGFGCPLPLAIRRRRLLLT